MLFETSSNKATVMRPLRASVTMCIVRTGASFVPINNTSWTCVFGSYSAAASSRAVSMCLFGLVHGILAQRAGPSSKSRRVKKDRHDMGNHQRGAEPVIPLRGRKYSSQAMIPVAKSRLNSAPGQMAIHCSSGRATQGRSTMLPSTYPPLPANAPCTMDGIETEGFASQPASNPRPPPTAPAEIMAPKGSETVSIVSFCVIFLGPPAQKTAANASRC